jgi:hypothetical protein
VVIRIVSDFLLALSGEKMRQNNLKRHIQSKHPRPISGGVPYVIDAATEWETLFPLHPPPTVELYGIDGHNLHIPSSSKEHGSVLL